MTGAEHVTIGASVSAIITGVITYLVARRKHSGEVDSTDADRLWAEAARHRAELRKRIRDLEASELARRIEIHSLRNEMTKLHFVIAGNVPEELQERLMAASREHIKALEEMLERKLKEPINGDDDLRWGRRFSDFSKTTSEPIE